MFLALHYLLPYLSVHARYLKSMFSSPTANACLHTLVSFLIAGFSPRCISCRKKCRSLPCRRRHSAEVTILDPSSFITQFISIGDAPFTLNSQSGTKYILGVLTPECKYRLFRYKEELYFASAKVYFHKTDKIQI